MRLKNQQLLLLLPKDTPMCSEDLLMSTHSLLKSREPVATAEILHLTPHALFSVTALPFSELRSAAANLCVYELYIAHFGKEVLCSGSLPANKNCRCG